MARRLVMRSRNSLQNDGGGFGWGWGEVDVAEDRFCGSFGARGIGGVDEGEDLARSDFFAEAGLKNDPDRVVDFVLHATAAAAKGDDGKAEFAGVHARDKTSLRGFDLENHGGLGEVLARMFQQVGGASETVNHFGENLGGVSHGEGRLEFVEGIVLRGGKSTDGEHLGGEGEDHLAQAGVGFFPLEKCDRLADFERVAGSAGERLVHIGEERGGRHAGAVGDFDEALGEDLGGGGIGHERAVAELHIHHEELQPGGEFFRENRGGDEVDRLHGRGDVAHGVDFFVRRSEGGGLADDCEAAIAHDFSENLGRRGDIVAGDRFEFVECAAGVAKAATGDHGHEAATGRDERAEHQRDEIAHAAGRVFVHHRPGEVAPIQNLPRVAHGEGEGDALLDRHSFEQRGHRERGDLAFADRAFDHSVDELGYLRSLKRGAVAFFTDDLLG